MRGTSSGGNGETKDYGRMVSVEMRIAAMKEDRNERRGELTVPGMEKMREGRHICMEGGRARCKKGSEDTRSRLAKRAMRFGGVV